LNWEVQVTLFEREGKMLKDMKCALCGEELIVPAWSEDTNAHETRNVWHCTDCGYVFESLDTKEPRLPFALAEQFLPSLVIA
jgi:ribosomal protein L37AE/L43A